MANFKPPSINDDLSYQDLSDRNLSNSNRSHYNLTGANLSGSDLSHCNLNGTNLQDARLYGASLKYATLCGTRLHNAKLSGADLCNADLTGAELVGADLRRCNFKNAKFSNTDLSDANVQGADFSGSNGLTEEAKRELKNRGAIFKNSVSRTQNLKWYVQFVIVPLTVACIGGGGIMGFLNQKQENCPKVQSIPPQKNLSPKTTSTNKAIIPNTNSK